MRKITVTKNEAGQKLLKLLAKYLDTAPQGFLHKMLRKKNITLNGKKADGSERLEEADEVCLFLSEETVLSFQGRTGRQTENKNGAVKVLPALQVLYEDEDILLLHKPAGVLSQKAEASDVSANEWLMSYLLEKGALTEEELRTFRPAVCNRLDRNTSGILTAGKSLAGLQTLSRLLKERSLRKEYVCIVCGRVEQSGRITGFLAKDEKTNRVTVTRTRESEDAAPVITEYVPVCRTGQYTLLRVHLITGKTHQIRAQLASVGYPLLGDGKYGDAKTNRIMREQFGLKHHLLHAAYLAFPEEMDVCPQLAGKEFLLRRPHCLKGLQKSLACIRRSFVEGAGRIRKERSKHGRVEFERAARLGV